MDQTAPFAVGDRVVLDNGRNNDTYGITWVSLTSSEDLDAMFSDFGSAE